MAFRQANWSVVLIGGPSGAGKTTVARAIGRYVGASWLHVDDVRLAFQRSLVTLPERTEALYFFERTPDVWCRPPEQLCEALITVGQLLAPALEVIIENHVDTADPIVIEGDGILPALLARPSVHVRTMRGHVRAIFLLEAEEQVLLANIIARQRGVTHRTEAALRTEARAKWLYGQWLAREAHRAGLPVLEARPWSTLVERVMAALSADTQAS
jgi:2-phosphoglycerate kinase